MSTAARLAFTHSSSTPRKRLVTSSHRVGSGENIGAVSFDGSAPCVNPRTEDMAKDAEQDGGVEVLPFECYGLLLQRSVRGATLRSLDLFLESSSRTAAG